MNYTYGPTAHCYRIPIDSKHRLIVPVDQSDNLKLLPQRIRGEEKVKGEWGTCIIARDRISDVLLRFLQTFENAQTKPSFHIVNDYDNAEDVVYWQKWSDTHKALLREITTTALQGEQLSTVQKQFDQIPFGEKLMRKTAERLQNKQSLMYSHRDYCGHGLTHDGRKFCLCEVWDGQGNTIASWNSVDEFVKFFAPLTDYICSGADRNYPQFRAKETSHLANQRITRSRLIDFAQL